MNHPPLMIDVSGLSLTSEEKIKLAKPSIGGVILFSRNYQDKAQLQQLTQQIRAIKPSLLIATDHEGGRVQRFRQGFTHLPTMAKLGEVYDQHPEKALKQAFSCGFILAFELLEVGVDFSFAPVLDVDYGNSSVIGDRAFHSHTPTLIKLAKALIDGMHEAGMKCVGKHFPGHGFVVADSHQDLPIDNRSMDEINQDMAVFTALKQKLDAVMPAHVVYSQVDEKPAGFSSKWIKQILRTQIGFKGAVFSDDLSMQGAHFIKDISQRVKVSLDSGCDMVLICNHPELVAQVIEKDWAMSKKLQSMQGYQHFNFDKIQHQNHLQTIQDLL